MENGVATQLIQVSVDISQPDTREREVRVLIKGMKNFGVNKSLILTFDAEEIIQNDGYEIEVRPVWKWLLDL